MDFGIHRGFWANSQGPLGQLPVYIEEQLYFGLQCTLTGAWVPCVHTCAFYQVHFGHGTLQPTHLKLL